MNKIEKPKNFFKDNSLYILGGLHLVMGCLSYLFVTTWNYILYFLIGIAAIIYGFWTKNSRREYIKWDKDCISIKDQMNGKLTYSWSEVDDIIFSQDHLTIKSGAANGVMLELRDYEEEDIRFLKDNLKPEASISIKP